MIQKELGAERIKSGVEDLFDSGNVDFAVFGGGVISMDQQGTACRQQEPNVWFAPEPVHRVYFDGSTT